MALTRDELAGLQELALPYFDTDVIVYRAGYVDVENDSPIPVYDWGDDEPDVVSVEGEGHEVERVSVWFYSRLQSRTAGTADAALATVDEHIVRAPVGTDIQSGDRLLVEDSGNAYQVVDTNNDDTWPEMMKVIVRRQE